MSETGLPDYLAKFQAEDEERVMSMFDESEKELALQLYEPCKITPADLQREYSPEEVRELCLRTKVRVNMRDLNCLWDAKERLGPRLDNRSESYTNRMLIKSVVRKMVEPYTDEEVAHYNLVKRSWLKKRNIMRLECWKRERESQSESISVPSLVDISSQFDSATDMLQLDTEHPEPLPVTFAQPMPLSVVEDTGEHDVQNVTQSGDLENVYMKTEPELWGIGDESDTVSLPSESQSQQNSSVINVPDMDWVQAGLQINSEALSLQLLNSTQSQPILSEDYNQFGTQVAVASTQEDASTLLDV
ncbi:telomere-binding protein cav-like [Drosophila guanche]|uniref:Blast:Telomere-binding protein cav n=1 Tax=Drosophila guanche TaxID=7266 RepID=A0A3B0KPN1_DROGU|nr:telomere-binding protein cav-like [Drosophila guanche]SPP87826.1 blast:Telomere-binding protein cav [Drosophila guanche]